MISKCVLCLPVFEFIINYIQGIKGTSSSTILAKFGVEISHKERATPLTAGTRVSWTNDKLVDHASM